MGVHATPWKFPNVAESVNLDISFYSWDNVNNIKADDGSVASVNKTTGGQNGFDNLIARDFSFGINKDHLIVGVEVEIEIKEADADRDVFMNDAQLYNSGLIGNDLWSPGELSTTFEQRLMGGPSNLWGATLTPAIVNSANFGFAIDGTITGTTGVGPQVDYIKMRVFYDDKARPFGMF